MTYTNKDLELLWLTSFRYCMGRSTYIVDDFKQAFIKNYDTTVQLVRHVKVCRCNMCGERIHKTVTEGKDSVKRAEEGYCANKGK